MIDCEVQESERAMAHSSEPSLHCSRGAGAGYAAGSSAPQRRPRRKRRPCKRRAAFRTAFKRDILNWFRFRLALYFIENGLSLNQASTITGASPALLSGLFELFDFGGFGSVAPHLSEVFPEAFDFDPREMFGPGTRYANMEAFLAIPAKPAPQA